MRGSTVADGSAVTLNGSAVNVAANWQVVEIGDFNGDGSSDILWRDGGTGATAEWLMTGNVVTAQISLTSNGTAVNPDPSWSVQAKPTNFA
jgi:enoyl-CoA hydratase/carnithine racemase